MSARNCRYVRHQDERTGRRRSARRAKPQCDPARAGRFAVILTEFLPNRNRPLTTSRVAGDTFTFVCSSQRLEQPPCFSRWLPPWLWHRRMCRPASGRNSPPKTTRPSSPTSLRRHRSRQPGASRCRTTALAHRQGETGPRRRELLPAVPRRQRPLVRDVPRAAGRVQPLAGHGRSAMAAAPACETRQPRRDRSAVPADRRGRRRGRLHAAEDAGARQGAGARCRRGYG